MNVFGALIWAAINDGEINRRVRASGMTAAQERANASPIVQQRILRHVTDYALADWAASPALPRFPRRLRYA